MDMTNLTGFDVEGAASRDRRRRRDSLLLIARLTIGDEAPRDVRIRNLSSGGLMAEIERVVAPGTSIGIEIRGIGAVAGSVAWCTQGRMGITLDRAIDPKQARKPVGNGTQTPFYAKAAVTPRR